MVPTVAIKNIYSLLDDIRSAGSSIVKATRVVLATASKAGCDVGLDICVSFKNCHVVPLSR